MCDASVCTRGLGIEQEGGKRGQRSSKRPQQKYLVGTPLSHWALCRPKQLRCCQGCIGHALEGEGRRKETVEERRWYIKAMHSEEGHAPAGRDGVFWKGGYKSVVAASGAQISATIVASRSKGAVLSRLRPRLARVTEIWCEADGLIVGPGSGQR